MSYNDTVQERFYAKPVADVYDAIKTYLNQYGATAGFKVKEYDDLSYSCTFTSSINMATWGEMISAAVLPAQDGCVVKLGIAGRIGATAQAFQSSHSITVSQRFFSGISAVLSGKLVATASSAQNTSVTMVRASIGQQDSSGGSQSLHSEINTISSDSSSLVAVDKQDFDFKKVIAMVVALFTVLIVICIICSATSSSDTKHMTSSSATSSYLPQPTQTMQEVEEQEEETFENQKEEILGIASILNCNINKVQDEYMPSERQSFEEQVVTIENYQEITWKSDKFLDCSRGYDAEGTPSEIERQAVMTAYGDTDWDEIDSATDRQHFRDAVATLHAICASTSDMMLSSEHRMSADQTDEIRGALELCPNHPRAEFMQQKVESDIAENKRVQELWDKGLRIKEGTLKVPDEVSYGTWHTISDKVENCYWETRDANGNIIENNFINGGVGASVNIYQGVASFYSSGCSVWEKTQ